MHAWASKEPSYLLIQTRRGKLCVYALNGLKNFSVPCCISQRDTSFADIQLHIFCDASLSVYAASSYLWFNGSAGVEGVSLIMAKCRITPLKPMTVPRLELQAALLGSRLAKYEQNECDFEITRRYLWTESTTVLFYIRSATRSTSIRSSSFRWNCRKYKISRVTLGTFRGEPSWRSD